MNATGDAPPADGRDSRRSWIVLVAAGIVAAFGAQFLWGATLGLFMLPLERELGWTRSDIGLVTAFTAGASFVLVPAMGWLIDRVRLRPLILVGAVANSLCIAAGALLAGSVMWFYVLVFGVMVFGLCGSLLTLSKIVRGWFDRSLGKAMGLLFSIASVGAIVNPLIAQALIGRVGWRDAYLWLGLGALAITTALAWFVIHEHPSAAIRTPSASGPDAPPASMRALLRTRAWWVLAAYNVFFGYAVSGVSFHMAPLLQDRGATAAQSAIALSLGAAGGLVGNLMSGWLIDRFSARLMASLVMLLPACGLLILLSTSSVPLALCATLVIGLSTGSEGSVIAVLSGRYFGTAIYGRAYSTQMVAVSLGSGLAPWLVGVMQERTGSYALPLVVGAAAFGASALLAWLLPRNAPDTMVSPVPSLAAPA